MENRDSAAIRNEHLAALREADSWEALNAMAQHLLGLLHLDGFMNMMRISDNTGRRYLHISSSLPLPLQESFREQSADDSDPVSRHAARYGIPLTWDIDEIFNETFALSYGELKRLGIHAGWSVAARSENSFSRIDVYSRQPFNFSKAHLHSDLMLFSCHLHDAARAMWLRCHPSVNAPSLTEREQQCLRWSAGGKTSKEIGMILGISPNTVYFHLKKAAAKFDVYGTRHAISRALEMGLL